MGGVGDGTLPTSLLLSMSGLPPAEPKLGLCLSLTTGRLGRGLPPDWLMTSGVEGLRGRPLGTAPAGLTPLSCSSLGCGAPFTGFLALLGLILSPYFEPLLPLGGILGGPLEGLSMGVYCDGGLLGGRCGLGLSAVGCGGGGGGLGLSVVGGGGGGGE